MDKSTNLSERLKNRSRQIKEAVDAESCLIENDSTPSPSLNRPFFMIVLCAIISGLSLYFLWKTGIIMIPMGAVAIMAVAGFVLGLFAILAHSSALQHELNKQLLAKLKGITQGVVVDVERKTAGAVTHGSGFTYENIFAVEYDINGQSYTTQ